MHPAENGVPSFDGARYARAITGIACGEFYLTNEILFAQCGIHLHIPPRTPQPRGTTKTTTQWNYLDCCVCLKLHKSLKYISIIKTSFIPMTLHTISIRQKYHYDTAFLHRFVHFHRKDNHRRHNARFMHSTIDLLHH